MSPIKSWNICIEKLKELPDNNQFTFKYCKSFSHIMVVDGKYFNVVNGKDNPNLKMAAYHKFPGVKIQTCHNHFKENIRRDLKVRSDDKYKLFMERIEDILGHKLNDKDMNRRLFALYRDYKDDPVTVSVLTNIQKYKMELLAYRGIPASPITTNIIEGMNGHIQQRLDSICSFQSVAYAKLWFNGYILKRRLTKFTDAKGKFRYMNGKTGVSQTKKQGIDIPSYF